MLVDVPEVVYEEDEVIEETHEVADVVNEIPPDVSQSGIPAKAVLSAVASQEDDAPPQQYPNLVISELQVNGECDGGSWCTTKGANVEFVELYNPNDFNVSLEGWRLQRQATGDTSAVVDMMTFGHVGIFAKEYVVIAKGLREPAEAIIATLPGSDLSNTAGSILLAAPDGRVVDMVGWGSSAKSYYTKSAAVPAKNQSMQRCEKDGVLRQFDPRNNFEEMLVYHDVATPGLGIECSDPPVVNQCQGMIISEVAANTDGQFIELQNVSDTTISLAGCQLQTNRAVKTYPFPQETLVEAGQFVVVAVEEVGLTLTKTTTGTVYLLSSDGISEVDSITYAHLAKDTSWSLVEGVWHQTYAVTPDRQNIYQQYLPCEEGYWRNLATGRCNKTVEEAVVVDCGEGRERNPTTGRCRNVPTARELTPCREGQYRSEETNRCRSIATAANALKPCADDQFRNPATNRCKKIASADELADCGEGRERNPATNRCRNVIASTPPAAGFAVEPIKDAANVFVGWWVLGGITVLALGYAGWEWREEVGRFVRKVAQFGRSK